MDGCTVTARNQRNGKLMTLSASGSGRDALRSIVKALDGLDDDWRIVSYSTPRTVLADVGGVRSEDARAQYPEVVVLGQIGRLDLLDPSLDRPHA